MKTITIIVASIALAFTSYGQKPIRTGTHSSGVLYVGYNGMTNYVNSVVITNAPTANDTITLNGVVFTFVATNVPAAGEVTLSTNLAVTATNLYTAVAAATIPYKTTVALSAADAFNITTVRDVDLTFAQSAEVAEMVAVSTNTTEFGYATITTTPSLQWVRLVNYSGVRVYYTIGSTNGLATETTESLDATGDTGGSDRTIISNVDGTIYLIAPSGTSNKVGYIKGSY